METCAAPRRRPSATHHAAAPRMESFAMSKARAHVRLRPNLPRPVDSPRPAEREAEAHQRQVSPPRHTH